MSCLKSPAGCRTCPWRIANPTVYQMSLFCRTNRPSQPALAMRSFNGAENSVRNHYRPCYGLCLFTKWPSGLGGEKKKKHDISPPPHFTAPPADFPSQHPPDGASLRRPEDKQLQPDAAVGPTRRYDPEFASVCSKRDSFPIRWSSFRCGVQIIPVEEKRKAALENPISCLSTQNKYQIVLT